MPATPSEAEGLAQALRLLYAEVETLLLARLARRVADGMEDDGWAARKLAEVRELRAEVERELARLRADGAGHVADLAAEAYRSGAGAAVRDLTAAGIEAAFGRTPVEAVEAFVREAVLRLESTHLAILRTVEDAYRSTIAEASGPAVVGAETRRQAAQRALARFADRGITGFVDSAGRRWSLDAYAEMATRTAVTRAYVQGHIDKLVEHGRDLVIVSNSPEECPRCRPWEGKVLSLTGASRGRVPFAGRSWTTVAGTLAEARAAGLFHPACTHRVGLFVPGLTRPLRDTANPEGYAERQRQRAIERWIRHWKRREAAAIVPDEQAFARRKMREWQAEARAFAAETGRRRRYDRESIGGAGGGRGLPPSGGSGAGGGRSDDPTDRLIRELARTGRQAMRAEVRQIRERLAAAPFEPRHHNVPTKLQGIVVDGRPVGNRAPSLLLHVAQRIDEGQWAPGTTSADYLADLRRAVRQRGARLLVYERRGGTIAAVLARNRIPEERLGPNRRPLLFVVYSADRGILLSGYQVRGIEDVTLGDTVRWLP